MKKITFFGNGDVLLNLIPFIFESTKYKTVYVGYAPRHSKSICNNGKTYEDNLKDYLKKYPNLSIFCFNDLDCKEYEKICKTDLQVSLGSAWIFKERHIQKANFLVHSHCTDLPKYRGGASSSWMLMSGYRKSAITIFKMDKGIDSGDLILKKEFQFPEHLSTPKGYSDYTEALLIKTLKKFVFNFIKKDRNYVLKKQDPEKATYFPRLSTEVHSWINWNWSCYEIISFVKAFGDPYCGAKTRVTSSTEKIIKIKSLKLFKKDGSFHPFKNGLIYRINDNKVYVAASPYAFEISDLFEINKNLSLKTGDRLYTFSKDIDNANSTRVYFSPN